MNNEKPFYKSKKFWYAVAIAFTGIAKEAGFDIPTEALYAGIALILGQALADFGKNAPVTVSPASGKAPETEKPYHDYP